MIFISPSRFVLNAGDDFLGCAQSAALLSDVFCLPSSYRRETPPKSKLRKISRYVWSDIENSILQQMDPSMYFSNCQSRK